MFVVSEKLAQQIGGMVERNEDWIPRADGVDESKYIVMNDFDEGVWLYEHNDHCISSHFTRVQRLA